MLATRVIPLLLQRGSMLVKGQQFKSWRNVGHALQAVRIHQARGVDELLFLDIGATPRGHGPNFRLIEELTKECFMPLTVGGGVRSVEDVRRLLECGADKVAVCTTIFHTKTLEECAVKFGSQAIVGAIDTMDGVVWSNCGAERWRMGVKSFSQLVADYGAGEILLTSIDRDGMMQGYDLDLIREVSSAVDVPVIACGGCGTYEHMLEAVQAGASAVAAGAMFQWTDATPRGAVEYLNEHNVEVRV